MPIGCGDAPVFPGDIILGDQDGIIVIPANLVDEIADEAFEMTAYEDFVTEQVRAGRGIFGLYPATDPQSLADFGLVKKNTWDGTGPLPAQYRVETGETGERRLKRCLIAGDADSDRFCAAYDRHLRDAHELLNEGQVAHAAGAHHHAVWTLKAVDVVLAQATLARARFDAGSDDWKAVLDTPRPEYDPRYRVSGEHPVGW